MIDTVRLNVEGEFAAQRSRGYQREEVIDRCLDSGCAVVGNKCSGRELVDVSLDSEPGINCTFKCFDRILLLPRRPEPSMRQNTRGDATEILRETRELDCLPTVVYLRGAARHASGISTVNFKGALLLANLPELPRKP